MRTAPIVVYVSVQEFAAALLGALLKRALPHQLVNVAVYCAFAYVAPAAQAVHYLVGRKICVAVLFEKIRERLSLICVVPSQIFALSKPIKRFAKNSQIIIQYFFPPVKGVFKKFFIFRGILKGSA